MIKPHSHDNQFRQPTIVIIPFLPRCLPRYQNHRKFLEYNLFSEFTFQIHPFFIFSELMFQRHPFFIFSELMFQRHPFFIFSEMMFQRHPFPFLSFSSTRLQVNQSALGFPKWSKPTSKGLLAEIYNHHVYPYPKKLIHHHTGTFQYKVYH